MDDLDFVYGTFTHPAWWGIPTPRILMSVLETIHNVDSTYSASSSISIQTKIYWDKLAFAGWNEKDIYLMGGGSTCIHTDLERGILINIPICPHNVIDSTKQHHKSKYP